MPGKTAEAVFQHIIKSKLCDAAMDKILLKREIGVKELVIMINCYSLPLVMLSVLSPLATKS